MVKSVSRNLATRRAAPRAALTALGNSARNFGWVAGLLVACGGQGERNHDSAESAAGNGGTMTPSAGSGGDTSVSGGGAQTAGGSAGAHATAGAAGHAGTSVGGSGGVVSGGAGAGGTAGGDSITTPEMLVPTVKAFCAAARTCCAKQPDPVMLDDCESAFGAKDETAQALARGTVTIDAADLAKCQAAYQAAATSCEENSVLAACAGIVHGTLAEGAPCTQGGECAGAGPKVCLVEGGQDSLGVCKAVPGGKVGDECSLTCRPNELCTFTVYGVPTSALTPCLESDGLFCATGSDAPKCQAILALGAACDSDEPCGYAAYCDFGGTNTCKKRGQLNEPCGTCISALSCVDGKCQSPPLTVGGTCEGRSLGPY